MTKSSPPEELLAAIDAGGPVVAKSTVQRYARLLDTLDRKCKKENRVQLGDITVKSVQLLAEKNVKMTNLKFLQTMDGSMPEGSESLGVSCVEMGALLVTMTDRE